MLTQHHISDPERLAKAVGSPLAAQVVHHIIHNSTHQDRYGMWWHVGSAEQIAMDTHTDVRQVRTAFRWLIADGHLNISSRMFDTDEKSIYSINVAADV